MLSRFIERFEKHFAPKIESALITPDAVRSLSSWGFSRNQIKELLDFVHQFDGSYANCLIKIQAMSVLKKRGRWSISVPHFNEQDDLPVGGSCREITDAIIRKVAKSGILEDVNKQSKQRIELRIVKGTNTTHFSDGGHVWACLIRGSNMDDMVVIDAAYQSISHLKSNGYRVWNSDAYQDVPIVTESELSISSIVIHANSIEVISINDRVLGLSTDKTVSFGFGYTTQSMVSTSPHFNTIIPFIRVGGTNRLDDGIFLLNPNSGEINTEFKNSPFQLSDSVTQELYSMLLAAGNIEFVDELE